MTAEQHALIQATADARRNASTAFLKSLIVATRDGEDTVQARVAEAARDAGCSVETIAYRPSDVPMVEEFAGSDAIDEGERRSVVARREGSGGGRWIPHRYLS